MNRAEPYLITFKKIGKPEEGYISVCESEKESPFPIVRTFWTYFTPDSITRGRHAHYETEMILVAAAGRITVKTETVSGKKDNYVLENPNTGLYIPKLCWHEMSYSHNAVQVVLASTSFAAEDYIRDYNMFHELKSKHARQP
jgi:hypothetical protein